MPALRCPTCGKVGDWLALPSAPFCSPRCRLLDLGKWFNEEHRVPAPLTPDLFENDEHFPPGTNPDLPEPDPGQPD